MQARVSREGTAVHVAIEVYIPTMGVRVFGLDWECSSEVHASLLTEQFKAETKEQLQMIRRDAYAQGWRDAKAKRRKETSFSGCWG